MTVGIAPVEYNLPEEEGKECEGDVEWFAEPPNAPTQFSNIPPPARRQSREGFIFEFAVIGGSGGAGEEFVALGVRGRGGHACAGGASCAEGEVAAHLKMKHGVGCRSIDTRFICRRNGEAYCGRGGELS